MLSFLPNKKFLADNLPEHRLTQECEIETFGPKRSNVCKTLFTSKQRHSFKKTKWSNLKDYKSRTCTVLQFEKAWEGWCKHSHIENRFSNWLFLRIPLKLALKFLLAKPKRKPKRTPAIRNRIETKTDQKFASSSVILNFFNFERGTFITVKQSLFSFHWLSKPETERRINHSILPLEFRYYWRFVTNESLACLPSV